MLVRLFAATSLIASSHSSTKALRGTSGPGKRHLPMGCVGFRVGASPKIRVTLLGGPYNMGNGILGILGVVCGVPLI